MLITVSILSFSIFGTVIYSVLANKKLSDEVFELRTRVRDIDHLLGENRLVIEDLIKEEKKIKEDIKATMLDTEAIANSINVYSKSITGNVAEKVKENVDLFTEWLYGEEDK